MCMCVCVCVCMYVCIACMYCVCACACVCVCVRMYVCMYVCMYVLCVCVCMYVCMYACMHACALVCMYRMLLNPHIIIPRLVIYIPKTSNTFGAILYQHIHTHIYISMFNTLHTFHFGAISTRTHTYKHTLLVNPLYTSHISAISNRTHTSMAKHIIYLPLQCYIESPADKAPSTNQSNVGSAFLVAVLLRLQTSSNGRRSPYIDA